MRNNLRTKAARAVAVVTILGAAWTAPVLMGTETKFAYSAKTAEDGARAHALRDAMHQIGRAHV